MVQKYSVIEIEISDEQRRLLECISGARNLDENEVVREALDQYLQELIRQGEITE